MTKAIKKADTDAIVDAISGLDKNQVFRTAIKMLNRIPCCYTRLSCQGHPKSRYPFLEVDYMIGNILDAISMAQVHAALMGVRLTEATIKNVQGQGGKATVTVYYRWRQVYSNAAVTGLWHEIGIRLLNMR